MKNILINFCITAWKGEREIKLPALPVPLSLEVFNSVKGGAASMYRKQHKRTTIITILLFDIMYRLFASKIASTRFGDVCEGGINNEVAKLNY